MTVEEARAELEKYGVVSNMLKVNFEKSEEGVEETLREMLEGFERLDEIEEELEELEHEKENLEYDLEELKEDLIPVIMMPLEDKADVLKAMEKLGIEA